MATLLSSEIVQISAQSFSNQVGAGAVFALGDEVDLLEHGRRESNQDLFGHISFPLETCRDSETHLVKALALEEMDFVQRFLNDG